MKRFSNILSTLFLLVMAACSQGGLESDSNTPRIRQIDLTEVIPVHESSLEYFDYVVTYQDNNGFEDVNTISRSSSPNNGYYVKTYSYKELPVICTATVNLIPKVPGTDVVSFTYIIPKPNMSAHVIYSSSTALDSIDTMLPNEFEEIKIQSMEIDKFLSTYGKTLSTHFTVLADGEGGIKLFPY